jgi:hypothetical protein
MFVFGPWLSGLYIFTNSTTLEKRFSFLFFRFGFLAEGSGVNAKNSKLLIGF